MSIPSSIEPNLAIRAAGLGKKYHIGALQKKRAATFGEALSQSVLNPAILVQTLRHRNSTPHKKNDLIWALRDVSFDVRRGEVVGIIGRNGAGKSTLLKVLTRIAIPDEGYAQIRGRVGSLLEVGTGFHFELTGRENVYLSGAILGMHHSEIDRKFDEIVDFAGIGKFIDTAVKHYSSGMYLRLAFAVAAHLETEILLVDEVLAVGDSEFQKKCLGKMGNIAHEGRTVLLVSHQMNAIQGLCERVIVLDSGHKVFDGPTQEGITYYLTSYQDLNKKTALADRTDREGTGGFRFQDISFKDGDTLAPVELLLSGQKVMIQIRYKNESDHPLKSLHIAITFWSASGQFMFGCSNEAVGGLFNDLANEGVLTCMIPKWPLSSGLYTYNLYSKESGLVSDWIKQAGTVQVEQGDFYGTGKLPAQAYQGVFVDYDWQVNELCSSS